MIKFETNLKGLNSLTFDDGNCSVFSDKDKESLKKQLREEELSEEERWELYKEKEDEYKMQ